MTLIHGSRLLRRPLKVSIRCYVSVPPERRRRSISTNQGSGDSSNCDCDTKDVSLPSWPSDKFSEGIDYSSRLLKIAPYRHHLLVTTPHQGAWEWPSRPESSLDGTKTQGAALRDGKQSMPLALSLFSKVSELRDCGKWKDKVLVNHISPVTHVKDAVSALDEPDSMRPRILHFPSGQWYTVVSAPPLSESLDSFFDSIQHGTTPPRSSSHPCISTSTASSRPVILICSHMSRDSRCGYAGPVLKTHIEHYLERMHLDADVFYIDHMGGHKFAGNCIFYVPPPPPPSSASNTTASNGTDRNWSSAWYGRVNLDNVQEVLEATLVRRERIESLIRYGSGQFSLV